MREGRVMLLFITAVSVYSLYVALILVPRARTELRRASRALRAAAPVVGDGEQRTRQEAAALGALLNRWKTRAATSRILVAEHVREFHHYGDVAHARVCVALGEGDIPGHEGQMRESLERTRGPVHVAVFWGAREANDTARRQLQDRALASRVERRRVVCGANSSEESRSQCAAWAAGQSGQCDYVIEGASLRQNSRLMGPRRWPERLVEAWRQRHDLGGALLVGGGGVTVWPRAHWRVFGAQGAGRGQQWQQEVYGKNWLWSVSELTAEGGAEESQKAEGKATADEQTLWSQYLCRVRLWTRYCTRVDVEYYLIEEGKSKERKGGLQREQFEAMESAARGGHTAPLESLLAAQSDAHAQTEREREAKKAIRKHAAQRLAKVLTRVGYSVDGVDRTVEDASAVSELRGAAVGALWRLKNGGNGTEKQSWAQLWALPLPELTDRAERILGPPPVAVAGLQRLLGGRAVLPEHGSGQEEIVWVLEQVREALNTSSGGEGHGQELSELEKLWPRFQEAWQGRHRLLGGSKIKASPNGEMVPCKMAEVTVPWPWMMVVKEGEINYGCQADAAVQGTRCCSDGPPLCRANFQGYMRLQMESWMKLCRVAAWQSHEGTPA